MIGLAGFSPTACQMICFLTRLASHTLAKGNENKTFTIVAVFFFFFLQNDVDV